MEGASGGLRDGGHLGDGEGQEGGDRRLEWEGGGWGGWRGPC